MTVNHTTMDRGVLYKMHEGRVREWLSSRLEDAQAYNPEIQMLTACAMRLADGTFEVKWSVDNGCTPDEWHNTTAEACTAARRYLERSKEERA